MTKPLEGLLVIALEQAVAAPLCSRKLADAGARVIKLERPEGDFARGYDSLVHGESAYFVWLNRGKDSVLIDLAKPHDRALLDALLAKADVFIQNLKPGAVAKLGFAIPDLMKKYPRLIAARSLVTAKKDPTQNARLTIFLCRQRVACRRSPVVPRAPRASASPSSISPPA